MQKYKTTPTTESKLNSIKIWQISFLMILAITSGNVFGQSQDEYIKSGDVFYENGDYDKAITAFSKAVKFKSDSASTHDAYMKRAKVYFAKVEYQKAIADLTAAIKICPIDSCSYCNRGIALAHLNEYDKAIKDYLMAIEIDPTYTRAYLDLGWIHTRRTEYDLAIQYFDKVIGS